MQSHANLELKFLLKFLCSDCPSRASPKTSPKLRSKLRQKLRRGLPPPKRKLRPKTSLRRNPLLKVQHQNRATSVLSHRCANYPFTNDPFQSYLMQCLPLDHGELTWHSPWPPNHATTPENYTIQPQTGQKNFFFFRPSSGTFKWGEGT